MPVIIPATLPATETLTNEQIFVMHEQRAQTQDIRPLKLAIVNLMPTKIVTETQLLRLISNTALQVEVDLIRMASHVSKNVSEEHLTTFYKDFDEKIIDASALTIKLPDETSSTNIVCFVISHETAFFREYADFGSSHEIEIKLPCGKYSVVIVDLLTQSFELMNDVELISGGIVVTASIVNKKVLARLNSNSKLLGESIGPDPNYFVKDYQFLWSWASEVMSRPIESIPKDRKCEHNINRYQKAADAKISLSREMDNFRSLVDRYRYSFGVYIAARNSQSYSKCYSISVRNRSFIISIMV